MMKLEPQILLAPQPTDPLGSLGAVLMMIGVAFLMAAAIIAFDVVMRRMGAGRRLAWLLAILAGVTALWLAWSTAADACPRHFSGKASFYSNRESGRRTASGARFDDRLMTAAHRCLPFGTLLRVSRGGSSVVVAVNDRGPFIRGRVLDLSRGAAAALGMLHAGVGQVDVEAIGGRALE